MPVARRKYDITPTEILEVARSATDAVVADLRARADELLPRQAEELRELADWLAGTVAEAAQESYRQQQAQLVAALEGLSQAVAANVAEQHGNVIQAVEQRLAGLGTAELAERLPAEVANAVAEKLAFPLSNLAPGAEIQEGLAEVRAALTEAAAQSREVELSRRTSLDRLDEVLVEVRSGISENVTRQHAVLLEVIETRLAELRLTELADDLPSRIGVVISDAIQRSHELQLECIESLRTDMATALDAGLERQRAAVVELASVGERLNGLADEVSSTVERLVATSFEKAQAAQMQRLTALVKDLGARHEESIEGATARLEEGLDRATARLEEGLDRATARMEEGLAETMARQERALAKQDERIELAMVRLEEGLDRGTARIEEGLAETMVRQERALANQDEALEHAIAKMEVLLDKVLTEVAGTLAEVLETRMSESTTRAVRVENLLGEVAWALGEIKAGTSELRTELARAAAELPESAVAVLDAAARSEARVVDLIARVAGNPAEVARNQAGD